MPRIACSGVDVDLSLADGAVALVRGVGATHATNS
jgi:hypothetical protein